MRNWVEKELAATQMKDQRLKTRLGRVLSALASAPERSVPTACQDWSEVLGAYRFFNNERVTFDAILSGHKVATLDRVAKEQVVLVSQGTTFLNFERVENKEGFGTLKEKRRDEYLLHLNVVFTDQRVNLGVVSGSLWQRTGEGIAKRRAQRPIEEKESRRWLDGYEAACDIQARYPQHWVISVADREGDIRQWYELAQRKPEHGGASYIVRAKQERRIEIADEEYGYLWEYIGAKPVLGRYTVDVPAKGGQRARRAEIDVRAGEVTIVGRVGRSLPALTLHAVLACEKTAPARVTPIRWALLTDIPAETYAEAKAVIEWYRCRWEIEVYFRVIKQACRVEALRLQTPQRIFNAIAVYLIIAWRLHMLTMMARQYPDIPCDHVLSEEEWQTIYIMKQQKPPPKQPPPLREITRMLAMLGGFLARKGDGEPGTQTIWVGYINLIGYIKAIRQMAALT